jgi:acid stress-induced BolA-like protein IbaG/YrbA
LKEPEFRLRRYGSHVNGSLISPTFKGKPDLARQQMIWNALEIEWGEQARQIVGMVLAYTPDEWYLDDESIGAKRARTVKAG